jgi:hypothetical protein
MAAEDKMVSDSERTKILEMIATGTITAEEGMTLLGALSESGVPEAATDFDVAADHLKIAAELDEDLPSPEGEILETEFEFTHDEPEKFETEVEVLPDSPKVEALDSEEINKWKRWWVIPLWIGVGITVIGSLLMFVAFSSRGFGFWFACSWFPFLLGVGLLALAWGSRTSPWLHVRVQQAPGETPQRIAISFPIPIRLMAWGLRTFGHFIPHMDGVNLEEIIHSLKDISSDEAPLFVDVDEGEGREKVQVFIG